MAYDVKFTIPSTKLTKMDIDFEVQTDDGLLGVLKISKGALVWVPKGKKIGHRIRWKRFDEFAREFPGKEKQQPKRGRKRRQG